MLHPFQIHFLHYFYVFLIIIIIHFLIYFVISIHSYMHVSFTLKWHCESFTLKWTKLDEFKGFLFAITDKVIEIWWGVWPWHFIVFLHVLVVNWWFLWEMCSSIWWPILHGIGICNYSTIDFVIEIHRKKGYKGEGGACCRFYAIFGLNEWSYLEALLLLELKGVLHFLPQN